MSKETEGKMVSRVFYVSDIVNKREFDTFSSLTKSIAEAIVRMREDWMLFALKKHGVDIKKNMSKRQVQEIFDKNKVLIKREKNDKSDKDVIYVNDMVIAEWVNDKIIKFNKHGALTLTTRHYIK